MHAEDQEQGLVLENIFPDENKAWLLTRSHGKVIATAPPKVLDFLWPGSVFDCNISKFSGHLFRLEQVRRDKIPVGLTYDRLGWLTKFALLCKSILPSGQACDESFGIIQKTFIFDWNSLEGQPLELVQKSCAVRFLQTTGLVFGHNVDQFCSIFQLIVESRVDPKHLPEIEFSNSALNSHNLDMSLMARQIADGFDSQLHRTLLELITLKMNQK